MTVTLLLTLSLATITLTAAQEQFSIPVTGGWDGQQLLTSSELIGGTQCPVPDLPLPREGHITSLTGDGLLLTCSGYGDLTCLSLDPESQSWQEHSVLDTERYFAASVSLPEGLYILGSGEEGEVSESTSSFLPTGATDWEAGPPLPGPGAGSGCAVAISDYQFLLIGGLPSTKQVVEYDTRTGNWTQWPELAEHRYYHSCAKLGENIIIAGGFDGDYLATTSILNISSQEERAGGDINTARIYFGLEYLGGKLLAFGGENTGTFLDTVEEWDEAEEQWVPINTRMETGRTYFASAAVPTSTICLA